jgi:hypothetical protein
MLSILVTLIEIGLAYIFVCVIIACFKGLFYKLDEAHSATPRHYTEADFKKTDFINNSLAFLFVGIWAYVIIAEIFQLLS